MTRTTRLMAGNNRKGQRERQRKAKKTIGKNQISSIATTTSTIMTIATGILMITTTMTVQRDNAHWYHMPRQNHDTRAMLG